ncbi:ABC transporter substrate-binding protein [Corynebacterium diphtheriae]|nr:ABC transporter substrate-binding protein [Corynebacterium diphtheriae]
MLRRDFLKLLAAATTITATGPVMAACSRDEDSVTSGKAATDTIRIAAIGGPGEGLNINEAMSTATWAAMYAVYESLVIAGDSAPDFQLAKSVEPNKDATMWTVTLRDTPLFSDGSPVTAADVVASLKVVAKNPMHGMTYADVDVDKLKAVDDSTAEIHLIRPRADFVDAVLGVNSLVYKNGDPSTTIGSGPYVVESGDSGQGWKLSANEHFPTDRRISQSLEIQVIADADARLRAVDSGAVDLAMDLPATAARSLKNAQAWIPGPADSKALLFVLNTAVAPFNDAEVRRAVKISLDRKAMVDVALDGAGTVGADIPGFGFKDYPEGISEVRRDLDAARQIFKDKGIKELTLVTADFTPGMNDGADIAAKQLADAGVKVTVEKRDPTTYFADMAALRALPFFASYIVNRSLQSALPFMTGSHAMFNLSGFGTSGDWDKRLAAAQAETNDSQRAALLKKLAVEMQRDGGDVLWGYANEVHGRADGIPDVPVSQSVPVPTTK